MNSSSARKYNDDFLYDYNREEEKQEYAAPKLVVRRGAAPRRRSVTSRLLCCGALLVAIVSVAIYGNVKKLELCDRLSASTSQLTELKDDGALLETKIESLASTKTIEEYASSQLGMGKVESYQVTYIHLDAEDTIEVRHTGLDVPVRETVLKAYNGLLEYMKLK